MKNVTRIIALMLCLMMVFCLAGCKKSKPEEEKPTETTTVAKPSNYNPLTGETDFNKDYIGKRPIAITIQNSEPRCRPQWGLCSADIVIEGEVEGTATKYLWLFADSSKVEKAGPFRSVRRDFVELAMGFDAILVHCGWSSGTPIGAAEYLNSTGYDHIDGVCKWGSIAPNGVAAPQEYCSYTNSELIEAAIENREIRTETESTYLHPFSFYDKATKLDGGDCNSIAFRIGNNNAEFTWKDGAYYGAYSGSAMKDNDGTLYGVSNVIVLYLKGITYPDGYRCDMDLSDGTGILASNGTYQEITWTKGDGEDMIKLFDKTGKKEVKLNVGKTYIALARLSNAEKTEIK
ncbi:MAG: DUF3048 domain-containing protein [Clostridia bacterium]|nr:DUF3048 domain-containing protein [Clostridia bacterium]